MFGYEEELQDEIRKLMAENKKLKSIVSGQKELLLAFGNFIASDTANLNFTSEEWVEMFLKSNIANVRMHAINKI